MIHTLPWGGSFLSSTDRPKIQSPGEVRHGPALPGSEQQDEVFCKRNGASWELHVSAARPEPLPTQAAARQR